MRFAKLLLLGVLALSMNSCALVFNGTKKSVNIRSMTPESKIYVDGEFVGTDIATVNLRRKDNHTVMVKKEGFKTQNVQIDSHVQAGWIVFDALFNWLAFLTDAPTGAWNGFNKTNITVELEKDTAAKPAAGSGSK